MLFRPAAQINAGLIGQAKVLLFRCPQKSCLPQPERKSRLQFAKTASGKQVQRRFSAKCPAAGVVCRSVKYSSGQK